MSTDSARFEVPDLPTVELPAPGPAPADARRRWVAASGEKTGLDPDEQAAYDQLLCP